MGENDNILELAKKTGFESVGFLDMTTLRFLPEVREMCEVNTCGRYGKSWACPPACGDLPDLQAKIEKYKEGILVQTVGQLEDSLDIEGIQEAALNHGKRLDEMWDEMKKCFPDVLVLGAGSCSRCKTCTYPDAPCRFPDKLMHSMEASGLMVNEVCTKNVFHITMGRIPSVIPDVFCSTADRGRSRKY